MDISLNPPRPAHSQVQRLPLDLRPDAACHTLHLRRGQQALLQVHSGRLWLTQDGQWQDQVLGTDQDLALRGPGCFRLSAWAGPCAALLALSPAQS